MSQIFSVDNLRFMTCAIFGAFVSYTGLYHEVSNQAEKIKTQSEINSETKASLKEISSDVLDIKLMLAKKFGG